MPLPWLMVFFFLFSSYFSILLYMGYFSFYWSMGLFFLKPSAVSFPW